MLRVIAWSCVVLCFAASEESHAALGAPTNALPTRTPQSRLIVTASPESRPAVLPEGAGVAVSRPPSADDVLLALDAARRLAVATSSQGVLSTDTGMDAAAGRPRKLRGHADAETGEAVSAGRELQPGKKSSTSTGTGTSTGTRSATKSASKTGR